MAVTGRGDFPLRSAWLSRGRGRGRGRAELLYETTLPAGGVAARYIWTDWLFESAGAQQFTLGPAVETDTALPLTVRKIASLVSANEATAAVSIAAHKAVAIAPAVESDSALALGWTKYVSLLAAGEIDAAETLRVTTLVTLVPAEEHDLALELSLAGSSEPAPVQGGGAPRMWQDEPNPWLQSEQEDVSVLLVLTLT